MLQTEDSAGGNLTASVARKFKIFIQCRYRKNRLEKSNNKTILYKLIPS